MTPNDRLLESFELRLRRHYKAAYLDAQRKAAKYAVELEHFDGEMRKALSDEEYDDWRRHKLARLAQYTAMRDIIAHEMTDANVTATRMLNELLPEVYAEGFNMGVYQLEHDFGLDTSFTLYDRATVTRLIRDNPKLIPDIKDFELKIPRDLRWNKARLNSDLLRGILNGDSVKDIAKRLPLGSGEQNLKGAMRRARTMVNGAENAGRVDSYKRAEDLGIEMTQEWMATLDNRTRHSHRQLDGEQVAVGEPFSNGCRFPGDPEGDPAEVWNCRCAIRGVLKKYPRTDTDQLRKDAKVGDMSYDEWKEAKAPKNETSDSKKREAAIEEIERQDKDLPYERGAIISSAGEILARYSGSEHAIEISDADLALMEGATFTHNHPTGTFFSNNDIISGFIKTKLGELRASTPGGVVYRLVNNGVTQESAQKYLAEYTQTSMRANRTAAEHFAREIRAGRLTETEYRKKYHQLFYQYRDEKLIKMTEQKAEQYGFRFEVVIYE